MSVKETADTSTFEDDADRVECACVDNCHCKNLSQPPRNCWRIHLLMWFNMTDKKLGFPNPQALRLSRNRLPCVRRVYCHLENWKTSDWGVAFCSSDQSSWNWGEQMCKQMHVLSNNSLSNLWSMIPLR